MRLEVGRDGVRVAAEAQPRGKPADHDRFLRAQKAAHSHSGHETSDHEQVGDRERSGRSVRRQPRRADPHAHGGGPAASERSSPRRQRPPIGQNPGQPGHQRRDDQHRRPDTDRAGKQVRSREGQAEGDDQDHGRRRTRPGCPEHPAQREPGQQHQPAERPDAGGGRDGIADDQAQGRDEGGREGAAPGQANRRSGPSLARPALADPGAPTVAG
jgi:hypothetical protein